MLKLIELDQGGVGEVSRSTTSIDEPHSSKAHSPTLTLTHTPHTHTLHTLLTLTFTLRYVGLGVLRPRARTIRTARTAVPTCKHKSRKHARTVLCVLDLSSDRLALLNCYQWPVCGCMKGKGPGH